MVATTSKPEKFIVTDGLKLLTIINISFTIKSNQAVVTSTTFISEQFDLLTLTHKTSNQYCTA